MTTPLDSLGYGMALAVRLSDDLTERTARGSIQVSSSGCLAFRNPSGYYVFLRLPAGPAAISIAPAYYLPEKLAATIPAPDPLLPLVEQTLLPSWLYPFPAGSTLVAGRVLTPSGDPVAGATIEGVGRTTRTGSDGRFVSYFRPLAEDDVAIVGTDRRRLVKAADGTTTHQLEVSHAAFNPTTVPVSELEEGSGRHLGAIVLTPI